MWLFFFGRLFSCKWIFLLLFKEHLSIPSLFFFYLNRIFPFISLFVFLVLVWRLILKLVLNGKGYELLLRSGYGMEVKVFNKNWLQPSPPVGISHHHLSLFYRPYPSHQHDHRRHYLPFIKARSIISIQPLSISLRLENVNLIFIH